MLQGTSQQLLRFSCSRLAGAASSIPAAAGQHRTYATEASDIKSYASFGVYKSKGCVQFEYIPPTWSRHTSKISTTSLVVERDGCLLLQAAPVSAAGAAKVGAGARSYNWERKITVALSALELGQLLGQEVGAKLEMYHDPLKNKPGEGETSKRVSVQRQADGARFLGIMERKSGNSQLISVPLTAGEYAVLAVLAEKLIPSMLGFDKVMQQPAQ